MNIVSNEYARGQYMYARLQKILLLCRGGRFTTFFIADLLEFTLNDDRLESQIENSQVADWANDAQKLAHEMTLDRWRAELEELRKRTLAARREIGAPFLLEEEK
jgi:hypothetical protein